MSENRMLFEKPDSYFTAQPDRKKQRVIESRLIWRLRYHIGSVSHLDSRDTTKVRLGRCAISLLVADNPAATRSNCRASSCAERPLQGVLHQVRSPTTIALENKKT